MCEFHDSNVNGFGDICWTDKLIYFGSIDMLPCHYYYYNAFIMRHTSGLKTCSEALTNIQYRKV